MFERVNGAIAAHGSWHIDGSPARQVSNQTRRRARHRMMPLLAGSASITLLRRIGGDKDIAAMFLSPGETNPVTAIVRPAWLTRWLAATLMFLSAITPAAANRVNPPPGNPIDLGTLGGPTSDAFGVSADGTVVVGQAENGTWTHAFRWTAAGGMVDLGDMAGAGGGNSFAYGVNADGTVVVGNTDTGNGSFAFRWTQAGMISLGAFPNGAGSNANAVNADGTVVVGQAHDGNFNRAFRWTPGGGMFDLGTLPGGFTSSATGVSGDGSIVVGESDDSTVSLPKRAFRWTQGTGMVTLGTLNGGDESRATAISSDGTVIVGYGGDGNDGNWQRAFRWTQATGMVSLGTLGGLTSAAKAVNADGTVIVGNSNDGNSQLGFRWTQATGMISVDQWLRNNGVTLNNDVTLTATGVSANGSVVVGTLQNGNAYIARGPVPVQTPAGGTGTTPPTTTTAGIIDVTNYQQSLAASPRLTPQIQNADLVMNGAHSSPLFMLLDAGQSSAWFTGDGGYANGASYRGGLGAGEFGFGRGLDGGWTVRVAGGGQYARMDTANAGNSVFSSGYVAPDVSYAAGNGVAATLSGYFNWGKADIRRGYLNGSANDSSFGSTATQTYGVRARVDWQDAFKLASTGISPFVSYTYLNSQMNGYTETGGSFPVRFDGSREISNTVRIGADAKTPLTDTFDLVIRLEYGRRFEKSGAGVSGQILGLSAFSLDGASVQQDFLRGGIGVSYKLGNGDGLVMVNSSNQTGKNTTWVSASYRVKF